MDPLFLRMQFILINPFSVHMREECVKANLIEKFIPHTVSDDLGKSTQVCRALGNICYDNGELAHPFL